MEKNNKNDQENPKLDDLVASELKPIFEDETIPQDKKEKISEAFGVSIRRAVSVYSGPMPPPDILKKYNDAVPDGAERILKMAEKQSEHRMAMEKHAIEEQFKQSKRGQIFGFIIAISFLAGSIWLAFNGLELVASIIAGLDIVGLVAVFVYGKREQKENLSEKNPN